MEATKRAALLANLIMNGRELPEATRAYYVAMVFPFLVELEGVADDLCIALGVHSIPPHASLVIGWVEAKNHEQHEVSLALVGLMIATGIQKQVEEAAAAAHQALQIFNSKNFHAKKEQQNGNS